MYIHHTGAKRRSMQLLQECGLDIIVNHTCNMGWVPNNINKNIFLYYFVVIIVFASYNNWLWNVWIIVNDTRSWRKLPFSFCYFSKVESRMLSTTWGQNPYVKEMILSKILTSALFLVKILMLNIRLKEKSLRNFEKFPLIWKQL